MTAPTPWFLFKWKDNENMNDEATKPHIFHFFENWFCLDQNGSLAIWWCNRRWHYLAGDAAQGILHARLRELG